MRQIKRLGILANRFRLRPTFGFVASPHFRLGRLMAVAVAAAASVAGLAHAQAPANDACSGAVPVNTPYHVVQDWSATSDDDVLTQYGVFTYANAVWYSFTSPAAGHLAWTDAHVIDPNTLAAGTVFAVTAGCDQPTIDGHEIDPSTSSTDYFFTGAGQSIWIVVARGVVGFTDPSPYPYDLTFTFSALGAPSNDDCANAFDLTTATLPYTTTVDTRLAGNDTASCGPVFHGVWYTYTAATKGYLSCTETGPESATWAVSVGSACTTPGCIGDDSSPRYVVLEAGQTARILVGTTTPDVVTGLQLAFSFTAVPNDTCATAVNLNATTLPYETTAENWLADNDATDCNGVYHGVWYTFTAPVTGTLRCRHAVRDRYEGTLAFAVEYASACGAATPSCLTPKISPPNNSTEGVAVPVSAGQTVKLLVGSTLPTLTQPNPLQLHFDFTPLPPNDDCAHADNLNGHVFPYATVLDNVAAADDLADCGTIYRGMWFSYTATERGTLRCKSTRQPYFSADQEIAWAVGPAGGCSMPTCVAAWSGNPFDPAGSIGVGLNAGQTVTLLVGFSVQNPLTDEPLAMLFDFHPAAHDVCADPIDVTALLQNQGTPNYLQAYPAGNIQIDYAAAANVVATCATVYHGIWCTYTNATPGPTTLASYSRDGRNRLWAVAPDCSTQPQCVPIGGNRGAHIHVGAGQTVKFVIGQATPGAASTTDGPLDVFFQALPDDCVDAFPVNAPTSGVIGETLGADFTPTFDNSASAACAGIGKQDLWYAVRVTQGGVYAVVVTPYERSGNPSHASLALDLFASCGGPHLGCALGVDGASASVQRSMTPGVYIARVASGTDFNSYFLLDVNVVSSCLPDFDANGQIAVADIFAFLNAWFAGDQRTDFNNSGMLEVQDIFDFLNAWFAGC